MGVSLGSIPKGAANNPKMFVSSQVKKAGSFAKKTLLEKLFGNWDRGGDCTLAKGPAWRDKYPGPQFVRRPLWGLEMKGKRVAFLRIYDKQGLPIPMYNGIGGVMPPAFNQKDSPGEKKSLGKSEYYTDFIVTSVTEQRAEKYQIVETFGEGYFYATGSRPRIIGVTGHLFNSRDFDWRTQFWENYERYLRGSRLIEMGATAHFGWDDIIVEGYILNAEASETAGQPDIVNFNFAFLVSDYVSLGMHRSFNIMEQLEPSRSVRGAMEYMPTGQLEVSNGKSVMISSIGMRQRQRLAKLGIVGSMLAAGSFDAVAAIIGEGAQGKTNTLESRGKDFIGQIGEFASDSIYRMIARASGMNVGMDDQCRPYSLSGEVIVEEWWKTVGAWGTKLLKTIDQYAFEEGIPQWVYSIFYTPDNFIKAMGGKAGPLTLAIFGALGLSMGVILGIGALTGTFSAGFSGMTIPGAGGLFPV